MVATAAGTLLLLWLRQCPISACHWSTLEFTPKTLLWTLDSITNILTAGMFFKAYPGRRRLHDASLLMRHFRLMPPAG